MKYFLISGAPKVEVDDKVVINLEERIMKNMQFQHGGWCDGMEKVSISFLAF